ncbi:MAG TPA: hypothetical protein VHT72_02395, partial [Puia sp.]|nr:hypothetical protein [Puia sp.]
MYNYALYQHINDFLKSETDFAGADNLFYTRFLANASNILSLYNSLYEKHPRSKEGFDRLLQNIIKNY